MTIGQIIESRRNRRESIFYWHISDFFSLTSGFHVSDYFNFIDERWYFKVFTRTDRSEVNLFLFKETGPAITVTFTFGIKGCGGQLEMEKKKVHLFGAPGGCFCVENFCHKSDLRNPKLVQGDEVIFSCRIKTDTLSIKDACTQSSFEATNEVLESSEKKDACTQTSFQATNEVVDSSEKRGIEKLSEDFGQLLDKDDQSDVILEVGDVTFRAHRAILLARCAPLCAMLRHDSTERASGKITIGDCEPDVFRVFLRHLYTGSAVPFSAQTVFGLYRVADKYLADDLKSGCLEHIRYSLSVRTFCDTVRLALTHGESDLLQLCLDFARENVQSILLSTKWQEFICECPREANEILIKSICTRS